MENLLFFCFVMAAMFIGEWISTRTKSWIPSIFVTALIFLIGFWTVLPKDLIAKASYSTPFINICIGLLLVHLGTLMNLKKLLQQWKAVCIALIGVAGTMLLTLSIGLAFFGKNLVLATVPTLTGGLVSSALMTQGIKSVGLTAIVAYPVAMFVVHHIVSFPLISLMLKQEGHRLQKVYANDPTKAQASVINDKTDESKRHQFFSFGKDYETSAFTMAKVAIIAAISYWISDLMGGAINANVLCLIFGVIFHEIGFLDDNAMNKAGVFNWLMYGLLAYILAELNATTPQTIGQILLPVITLIILGLIGMFIASFLLAKPFGMSRQMAFACSLTALCGFPSDYILTTDVVNNLTKDKQEQVFLLDNMLPKMLVGGFATVSVAAVFVASFFLKML